MINKINEDHPLELVESSICDQAAITGMVLSPDGTMLATFCNLGSVRIWSLEDYSLLKTLRDAKVHTIVCIYYPGCLTIFDHGEKKIYTPNLFSHHSLP